LYPLHLLTTLLLVRECLLAKMRSAINFVTT
jgi:hypothetical protein